jgi:hypothetical protein
MKFLTSITFFALVAAMFCITAVEASAQIRPATKTRNYRIVVNSVEVTKTKASGHEWDHNIVFNAPDLRVEVMRRDATIERRIALLQRQEMLRRSQIMNDQWVKNSGARNRRLAEMMKGDRFSFGGDDFAGLNEMSEELLDWQEAEAHDPQLQKITEELAELHDRIARNTPVAENTFKAEFGVQTGEPTVDVAEGESVKLTVWDDDIASHDLVGSTTLRITKAAIDKGHFDVMCGKVISLQFEILPVE